MHDNTNTNFCTSDSMKLEAIGCSAHLLDLTLKEVIEIDSFQTIFSKSRKISNHFQKSALAFGLLKQIQKDRHFPHPKKTITI